jgi:hypothetical protein
VGRGLFSWLLCLVVLLGGFLGAQMDPLASLVVGVLAPLPLLLIGRQWGWPRALGLALSVIAVIFSLHPALDTILHNLGFFTLLAMGVILAGLQERGITPPLAIIWTVLALAAAALLVFLGEALFQGLTPQALLAQKSAEVLTAVQKVLGDSSAGPSVLVPGVAPNQLKGLLQLLLPGLMITNMALVAWLNVVLARQIAFILGWGEPDPPLYHWAAPEWLVFLLLTAGFLLLIPVSGAKFFGLNLFLVVALFYFGQGMAIVSTWFHRLGLPRPLRVFGYPLLFLNPFFILIVVLGLMDLWFDFRRLHQPRDV